MLLIMWVIVFNNAILVVVEVLGISDLVHLALVLYVRMPVVASDLLAVIQIVTLALLVRQFLFVLVFIRRRFRFA